MEVHSPVEDMTSFIQKVPQIVPESWCMKCQICCRFPDTKGVQTPTWSPLEAGWAQKTGGEPSWFRTTNESPALAPNLEPCGSVYHCPAFRMETNRCSIYSVRPLDCRLYPFVLTRDSGGTRVTLAMDMKCPFLQQHGMDPEVSAYSAELARYLETPEGIHYLKMNPDIVGSSWPEFVSVAALSSMTASLRRVNPPPHPALQPLMLENLSLLKEALTYRSHAYSGYTVAGLLGWSDLIQHWWASLEGAFCVFAEQAGGFFMPLPPLERNGFVASIDAAWEILQALNRGSEVSRIEGIEPEDAARFSRFRMASAEQEYLYRRLDLASLRGNRYRSQRGAINRCVRRVGPYRLRPFLQQQDIVPCLQLYTRWGIHRQQTAGETFPRALVRDGLFFHRRLMVNSVELGVTGRVLEADGKIIGYTFGAPVSNRSFCVFLEIVDPAVGGLPQLLFREFCRELGAYETVNAMGDSGLRGLQRAKISYRPIGTVDTLTAQG